MGERRFPYRSDRTPNMRPRERVLRALRRDGPDKVPTCARFTPIMMRVFNEQVGAGIPQEHLGPFGVGSGFILEVRPEFLTPDDYFGWDVRHIAFKSPSPGEEYSRYHPELPPEAKINEWGVAFLPGSVHHYTRRIGPLQNMSRLEELEAFTFPDPMSPEYHRDLERSVEMIHEDGYAAAGFMQQTLFELAWEMRGMDQLLMDFLVNKAFAERLLDTLTEIRCAMAGRYARAGVDIIRLGDDLGTQQSLLMSPATFREMLKPRLRAIIEAARREKPDVLIFFHSDGSVTPLIEDFIDMGVDVLNPVQPECIDLSEVKKRFADCLSFWGGVGIQTTMPFGSPVEVKDAVRRVIDVLGDGGGLLVAPTHALQPDVPWENVVAFFEAVNEFGWY